MATKKKTEPVKEEVAEKEAAEKEAAEKEPKPATKPPVKKQPTLAELNEEHRKHYAAIMRERNKPC